MGRYERRQYFESLCEMRDQYALRPVDDQVGNLLVEDAMIYAEAVMLALEAEAPEFEEQAAEAAAEAAAAGDVGPAAGPELAHD
jgi:hypothetical protein